MRTMTTRGSHNVGEGATASSPTSVRATAVVELNDGMTRRLVDPLVAITNGVIRLSDLRPVCEHIIDCLDADAGTPAGREFAEVVLKALWDDTPPTWWWRTTLGRLIGRSVPDDYAQRRITQHEAALILDVHPGTIAQLVHRDTLPRVEGGLRLGDVLDRLNRLTSKEHQ